MYVECICINIYRIIILVLLKCSLIKGKGSLDIFTDCNQFNSLSFLILLLSFENVWPQYEAVIQISSENMWKTCFLLKNVTLNFD